MSRKVSNLLVDTSIRFWNTTCTYILCGCCCCFFSLHIAPNGQIFAIKLQKMLNIFTQSGIRFSLVLTLALQIWREIANEKFPLEHNWNAAVAVATASLPLVSLHIEYIFFPPLCRIKIQYFLVIVNNCNLNSNKNKM